MVRYFSDFSQSYSSRVAMKRPNPHAWADAAPPPRGVYRRPGLCQPSSAGGGSTRPANRAHLSNRRNEITPTATPTEPLHLPSARALVEGEGERGGGAQGSVRRTCCDRPAPTRREATHLPYHRTGQLGIVCGRGGWWWTQVRDAACHSRSGGWARPLARRHP